MLGNAFVPTMRAAQAGDDRAFARLWRDANPLMVRYLRVIGVEDPYDSACEGWVSIVRGVGGFEGDEKDWRLWVCTCVRMRAEESSLRSWSPLKSRASHGTAPEVGPDDIDLEDLMEPGAAHDPQHREVDATIAALRMLPMGQGEVVDLRYGWGLAPTDVAGLVGLDSTRVREAEARALERLATPAELLEWSLNAPATPAELADERIATAAFRSAPKGPHRPVGVARVIALGGGRSSRRLSRAGHPRTAVLGIAALSASMMSVGGLSAAAYAGVLPASVQQIAHDVVGAPPPKAPTVRAPSGKPVTRGVPTAGVGPGATAEAAPGLCLAWAGDKAKGTSRSSSVAFRTLSRAAGGDAAVDGYCAAVLAAATGGSGKGAPTAGTGGPSLKPPDKLSGKPTSTKPAKTPQAPQTGKPTSKPTGKPTSKPTSKPTGRPAGEPTRPANGNGPTTMPSTKPATKPSTTKAPPTKAPTTESAETRTPPVTPTSRGGR